MRLSTATTALILGMLGLAQAHAIVQYAYVNGKSEGLGTCLRSEHEGNNKPIEDVTSDNMACGFDGTKGVARVCPVNPGDEVTFEWYHSHTPEFPELYYPDGHFGPCSFMMKKVDSAINSPGTGDGWFRIGYEGYNNKTGKWCGQRVAAEGRLTVKLPEDLAGGSYLIRPELLALHNAHNNPGAPQFYVSCFQVFLNSAGTAIPKDTVAIPGDNYASPGSKAMTWNLYEGDQSLYPGYGPPTYVSSGKADAYAKPNLKQTEGLRKENCILETHNFCATEVPKYSNTDDCWKSSKNCWGQADVCWKSTPLDNSPCKNWQKKCEGLDNACKSGSSSGPPDEGKIIDGGKPPALNPIPPPLDTLGNTPPKDNHNPSGSSYGNAAAASYGSDGKEIPRAPASGSGSSSMTTDAYLSTPTSSVEADSASSSTADSNGGSSKGSTTSSSSESKATGGSDYGSYYGSSSEASPTSSGSKATGGSDYGSVPSSYESANSNSSEAPTSKVSSPTTSGSSDADATGTCTEKETDIVVETVTVTATPSPNTYRHRRRHGGRVY